MYATNISSEVVLKEMPQSSRSIPNSLTYEYMEHNTDPHDNALGITTDINQFDVKRILVDSGSLIDVLFLEDLLAMWKTKMN